MRIYLILLTLCVGVSLWGVDVSKVEEREPLKEEVSETQHKVVIDGKEVPYKALAGTMLLKDRDGKAKASMFYIAYTNEGVEDKGSRPLTFCFNGGPGSASVWLHLGAFGPKIVKFSDEGYALPPYGVVENPYSLLDVTDLVFIDPVSTGYSRAVSSEDAKKYHGVDEDIKSVGEFIRLYVTRNGRWGSPKFLAGESYGTTRAAGLAEYLHDEHYMYLSGLILISSVLNYQTIVDPKRGNDMPYMLFLPSYTAAAWYHKKLPEELQKRPLDEVLADVELFVMNDYSQGLMKGAKINKQEKESLVKKLSYYTGLSENYILQTNLRINVHRFSKELLRSEGRTIGRFDSRLKGIERDAAGEYISADPSMDAIFGGFTAAFNQYIREELKWEKDEKYTMLAGAEVRPWSYGEKNEFLSVGEALRDVMTRNAHLRVFVGSGYYDLATPYFASEYTVDHLGLDPTLEGHVSIYYYDGGHMMYTSRPSLIKLKKDLAEYIQENQSAVGTSSKG